KISRRREKRRSGRRPRRRRRGELLDLSEAGVKLGRGMGPRARIAAVTVVVCLAAGTPGAPARAGDLAPPVPNVPSVLPDATGVMAFENRSGVQGLGWMSAGAAFLVGEKVEAARALRPVF